MKKHINSYLHHFKQSGCQLILFGQPVVSYSPPFVTVVFLDHPHAENYKTFNNGNWKLHSFSPLKHNDYRNGVDYIEVTFEQNGELVTEPEKMPQTF